MNISGKSNFISPFNSNYKIMEKKLLFVLLLAALMSCKGRTEEKAPAPGAPPERRILLNVPLIQQKTDQWCWAASAEMIMTYHGNPESQCNQANHKFGRTNCCSLPTPMICVQPAWPEYNRYGFHFYTTRMGQALSWEELKREIDLNRPVSFSWGWTDGGGHMMDAVGYVENATQKLVAIHDPWKPSAVLIPYHEYVSSNRYSHWADYYEIRRRK